MSEADSAPRRRPPTIDLTAQEVESGQAESASKPAVEATADSSSGTSAGRRGGNLSGHAIRYAVGAIAGAAAAAVVMAVLWISGALPLREAATVSTAAPPAADVALDGRMNAAEAQTKTLSDALAALTHRVDDAKGTAQTALMQAKAAASAAEAARDAAQTNIQRSDIDALNSRLAALEHVVKSLSADLAQRSSNSTADDRVTRATVTAEVLRAAVERGAPYEAELAAAKALGADAAAVAALEPFAGGGVPSAAVLGRELLALLPAMQQAAEPKPLDNSFLGRLESHAQKLVRITPIDTSAPRASDDHSSALAHLGADAERGDIAAALANIGNLPDATRVLADGWVKKAQAREAALAASRRIAADALASLAKPVSQ